MALQAKIKVNLNTGQSFVAPETNIDNIRRIYDSKIESIEYNFGVKQPPTPQVNTQVAQERLQNLNAQPDTTKKDKLVNAGWAFDGSTFIKGKKAYTVEQIDNMLPMHFGKLIK